jgi:alkylhydroperoxidase family enzyme
MEARDPFPRRTVKLGLLAPWLIELGRTVPGLVQSYVPGVRAIDARTRQRVILAVTEVNGCRYCAWIHGSWRDFLGEGDGDELAAEDALLGYARACAEAGRPVDPGPLEHVLTPDAIRAVRATVAQVEVSNLVGNTVDGLVARFQGRRPADPLRAAGELLAVAAAVPLAAPLFAAAGVMRLATRVAPAAPAVLAPPPGEANLLAHLLGRAVPAYLSHALVRLLVLELPVSLTIGVRAGRSGATVRVGRGAVSIENGIARDAVVVVEGDVEPLLRLASGSILRELASVRLRPNP